MQPTTQANTLAAPQRVIPLLQAVSRLEETVAAMAMRLDPVTNHTPSQQNDKLIATTVTGRLNSLGDSLQYLLDNIEL